MKLKRLGDMFIDLVSFPFCIVFGLGVGLGLGWVMWHEKLRLTWSMRNSDYVWESTDSKPIEGPHER